MSLLTTPQSSKLMLTEAEEHYFASQTDDNLQNFFDGLQKSRTSKFESTPDPDRKEYMMITTPCRVQECITPYTVSIRILASVAANHIPNKTSRIIDIAAGCGHAAFELKKLGYENIDALEPAQNMIAMLPKDLYGKVYKDIITDKEQCSVPTEHYDYAIIVSGMYTNHIEVEAFPEILRLVKPGGYIFLNICDRFYNHENYGTRFDQMLQQQLEKDTIKSYTKQRCVYLYKLEDGNVYIIQKAC